MDEISEYNRERWNLLVKANAVFTRPQFDLNEQSASELVNPGGVFPEIAGKNVLCLASGGGQQSAAFAILGANVTAFDISDLQLEQDRAAAAHYGVQIETVQGDMRDLSAFEAGSFDIVFHSYSINFVPDSDVVFRQIARVLKTGGIYRFNCANPFFIALKPADWNGDGYSLKTPYSDGAEIVYEDESWIFRDEKPREQIPVCREFRHNLSTLVNNLIKNGFVILKLEEENYGTPDLSEEPGTYPHFTAFAPPWLRFWARLEPNVFEK